MKILCCGQEDVIDSSYDEIDTWTTIYSCMIHRRIFKRTYGAKSTLREIFSTDDEYEKYLFWTY
jgi:hypothetical protein